MWCTQKFGVGDKNSGNIIYSLILVSDWEILCSEEKVSVLIIIQKFVVFTGDGFSLILCTPEKPL